jgi:Zn-dependent M28 family amino/carboxypeptidase
MKKCTAVLVLVFFSVSLFAQKALKVIRVKETTRIEQILSSDAMEGRRTFTPGIEKAAAFISAEFEKTGLEKWKGSNSYLQSFAMVRTKPIKQHCVYNGTELGADKMMVSSPRASININERSGYVVVNISSKMNFSSELRKVLNAGVNTVVVADTAHTALFNRFRQMRSTYYADQPDVVVLLASSAPARFDIAVEQEASSMPLANVVGVLPGKSRPDEFVVFSGHYDHLGINSNKMVNNDSIYNGANDDAAGTTAMIMLAKYFKKLNNNERTLVFAAFTAEEIGGYGATHFSKQFDPNQVMAMFNIEMIGTESKWGKNSAYITGFEKTNMGELLQNNLQGTGFTFYPDPYPAQQLFYRSDNATLARLGVPAHTISTSKMDAEPNYHKASDEIGTLDLENMTAIIRAIALSSRGIVSGKETPTRVDIAALR